MTVDRLIGRMLRSRLVLSSLEVVRYSRDVFDRLLGRADSMIPPTRLMHDGPRSISRFRENGEEFLKYYVELCHLQRDERVLDVGCGIGRKTLPLTTFLSARGRYDGIDIVATGIEWCKEHISTKYQNFQFHLIDVFHKVYNPRGRVPARDFRFPFDSNAFDFVVAASVFTHLTTRDAVNYLNEIARVLRPGGRCLISFFLINAESKALMTRSRLFRQQGWQTAALVGSTLNFKHELAGCYTIDPEAPERAIAYDESFVLESLKAAGLRAKTPIAYGSWCGRQQYMSVQDLIVASKN